jgi:hypothetical protein
MNEDKHVKRHRWLVWATIVSIVALLISPMLIFREVNRAAFNRKVAELKASGYPVSLDDLEAAYVLPEGAENAADVYMKAFRAYVEPNEAELKLLPVRGSYESTDEMPPYPTEVIEAIQKSLEKNKEFLSLIDEAGRIEHCQFPRVRQKIMFSNDFYTPLKEAVQVVRERNILLAQSGQTDALYESTLSSIGMTKAFSTQPQLIDHLVTVSMKAIAASGLEDSLNLTRFSEEQLAVLQQRIKEMREADTFFSSLVVERTITIEANRLPIREWMDGTSVFSSWENMYFFLSAFSGMKEKDSVLMLDLYEKQLSFQSLPYYEQFAEYRSLDREIESYSMIHYVLIISSSSSFNIVKINLRVTGQMLCAETALAAERYRLKYGKLPEGLDKLVPDFLPEVYLDPFDGKPLRYVLRPEGGYVIYCVGEDGVDNGGLDQRQMGKLGGTKSAKEYDWPFTVKR